MPCLDQNTVIVDFRLALYINLVRQQDYRYVSQDRTTALCTRCTMPDTSYGLAVYSTYRMPSSSLLFTGPFSAIITVRTSSGWCTVHVQGLQYSVVVYLCVCVCVFYIDHVIRVRQFNNISSVPIFRKRLHFRKKAQFPAPYLLPYTPTMLPTITSLI